MKKKFLTVLIAGFLMIGCDDKPTENKTQQPTATSEAKPSDSKKTEDVSRQFALKARKGNIWLEVFNANVSQAADELRGNGHGKMTSSLYHLDNRVKDFLRGISDKNGRIDVNRVKKNPTKLFIGYHPEPKELDEYKQLITELLAFKPELPELDAAGKALSDKYVEIGLAYDQIAKYYLDNEYKLDDFAKLPELLNNLNKLYNQYIEAKSVALAAYGKLYQEIHAFQKSEIKNKGLTLNYNCMEIMDLSEDVIALINESFTEDNQFKNLDKSALEQKIQQIESIADELITNKGKNKLIKQQGLNDMYYDRFVDRLPGLINQMKIVLKNLQTNTVEREVDSLNRELKSVIDGYNQVIN
ncbi:DUF3829 domain-containing protein [Gilliamella sp. Pas-s25]|uniref:DUF3829 domain-containing protein n=1 Tax=Gilliamella sp. Pas-s25 TaxID=2687310 RepID=UPI00135DF633|nr:DUF3829 domain-containing protein [Gilliamella sp. Pas-s25]MWP62636.1 DUF3829 domain-containing protein [Gilliamella sp. Pas-s25]